MTLFDNRHPGIVVLRRTGRTFANAGGACRAVIGCALAGALGIAPGRVRTGCRSSRHAALRLVIRLVSRAIALRLIQDRIWNAPLCLAAVVYGFSPRRYPSAWRWASRAASDRRASAYSPSPRV
jgi:hypothetical protein